MFKVIFYSLALAAFGLGEVIQLNEETLLEQNKFRALHNTLPLKLDQGLIELAQNDAKLYALTGLSQSVVYKGVTLGKNIAIFKGYNFVKGSISVFCPMERLFVWSLRLVKFLCFLFRKKRGRLVVRYGEKLRLPNKRLSRSGLVHSGHLARLTLFRSGRVPRRL